MLHKLKAFVKSNRLVYTLYFHVGSFFIRFFGLFVKVDPNQILFVSYGGQKYDDSPRVVYEYLLENPVSPNHKYVWAFINPDAFPQVQNKVKIDSLSFFITAMKSGCWITNSSVSRGLKFKKRETKYYLFQHGMAGIKKIGSDIQQSEKAFVLGFKEDFDGIFVEGAQEVPLLVRAWQRDPSVFHITGLPRNDNLVDISKQEVCDIKSKLGIPGDKKVILYAPTFREFSRDTDGRNALGLPFDFTKWEKALGHDYVLLVTAHYEVATLLDALPENNFVFNAFKYPELNDLLKVSDILISDYSSIFFDYSILERPMLCYGYDYDSYAKDRGLYCDLNELFSHGVIKNEDALIAAIRNMDYATECDFTRENIKGKYIGAYGNAAEKAVKVMFFAVEHLQKEKIR